MIDEQRISFTLSRADAHERQYRLFLRVCATLDAIAGLLALFAPSVVLWALNQPGSDATAWVGLWGATEFGLAVYSATGLRFPAERQSVNWIGAVVRMMMAAVLLPAGGRFLPILIWQAIAGIGLFWLYWRFLYSHLEARP